MPITLKQLAQGLGLHHSTVAYALSGKGTVKEATRQRVRAVAAQMGYVPNGLARRMRSRKTNVVGLVIPDVLINYNELIQEIFRGAMERGYDAQIAMTEFKQDWEDKALRFLMESRVDGIILKTTYKSWDDVPERHALRQLDAQRVPTVLYGFPITGSPFPYVSLPLERQGEMLTEHLLALGHRKFAWLLPARGPLGRAHRSRVDGSRKVLQAAGLSADALKLFTLDDVPVGEIPVGGDDNGDACLGQLLPRAGIRGGRVLMRQAMAAPSADRPTALLCVNETTAIGAAAEAQEMGLRLPMDVTLAAANRSVAAELSPISLTTADVDTAEVSKLALELLIDTMKRLAPAEDATNEPLGPQQLTEAPAFVTPVPKLVIGRSTQP